MSTKVPYIERGLLNLRPLTKSEKKHPLELARHIEKVAAHVKEIPKNIDLFEFMANFKTAIAYSNVHRVQLLVTKYLFSISDMQFSSEVYDDNLVLQFWNNNSILNIAQFKEVFGNKRLSQLRLETQDLKLTEDELAKVFSYNTEYPSDSIPVEGIRRVMQFFSNFPEMRRPIFDHLGFFRCLFKDNQASLFNNSIEKFGLNRVLASITEVLPYTNNGSEGATGEFIIKYFKLPELAKALAQLVQGAKTKEEILSVSDALDRLPQYCLCFSVLKVKDSIQSDTPFPERVCLIDGLFKRF